MCQVSSAIFFESVGPVVAAAGEDLHRFIGEVNLHAVASRHFLG
jgi:hypothetical protein